VPITTDMWEPAGSADKAAKRKKKDDDEKDEKDDEKPHTPHDAAAPTPEEAREGYEMPEVAPGTTGARREASSQVTPGQKASAAVLLRPPECAASRGPGSVDDPGPAARTRCTSTLPPVPHGASGLPSQGGAPR